jgi:uncharacterized protein (DUF2345 family)
VVLENGNVKFIAPGKYTVRAGRRSFVGPSEYKYSMPVLPQQICVECLLKARGSGSPFATR